MSPYITTKHKYADKSRRNMPRETVHVLVSLNVIFIVLAVLFAVGYLVLLNALVSRGHVLKSFEQQFVQLNESQEKLNRDLGSLRSMDALSLSVSTIGLIKADQFSYAKPSGVFAKNMQNVIP